MIRNVPASLARATLAAVALAAAFCAAAAPKAYVGNFKDNTVSAIDTGSGAVVATIPVAAGPHGMGLSPDGRTLYVNGDGSSELSVIDTATDRVTGTINVGKSPHGMAMTADGRTLLVCVYGEDKVVFIDTATQKVVGSVPVPKPHTISIRPDGRLAYASSQEPGKFALVVADIASRSIVKSVPLEKTPRDLEFGYDGKALYFTMAGVSAVEVLDPSSDKIVAEIPTGASPHIASLFRGAPAGTVVVQGPGELTLFNPATNTVIRSVAVGRQPHWVAASGDGKSAYVTNEGSNDVTVVDLATGQTKTIAVGTAPRKVVVQRGAVNAADAGSRDARVSIANFAFVPPEIKVVAGQSVTWSNDDGAPHGLMYKDGAVGTDLLLPGKTFSRTFDKAGTYEYACSTHPYMMGKVVVSAN